MGRLPVGGVQQRQRPYLQSRRGADLTAAFPEIATVATALRDVVVDGELVIWGSGALDFPALLQRMASRGTNARQLAAARPANYVGVNILGFDGDDLRREPLHARRRRLEDSSKDGSAVARAVAGHHGS